ncbi:MAG TPA: LysR family transcriptional regulator [Cellulomonas sp.]
MDLRQMEYAVAVADEGGFSAAARRLHVVQSAVSSTIGALENELGKRLFDRTTHRVVTTEAGDAFIPAARAALLAAREARDSVRDDSDELRGRVRIGVMQGLHAGLDRALAALREQHPKVQVQLRQAAASDIVEALRDGRLDLAVIAVDRPERFGLPTRTLLREDLVLVTAPGCDIQRQTPVTVHDLAGHPLVDFSPGWAIRTAVDRAFAEWGTDRQAAFEVNDVLTAADLVRQDLAVCMMPASLAARFTDLDARRFAEPVPGWTIMVVQPAATPAPAVTALLEHL